MSKYQKLDSAMPPTAHEDDCAGGFPLYFNDNPQAKCRNQSYNLRSNGVDSGAVTAETNTVRILEERTWEVPLLGDSEDSASNQVSAGHLYTTDRHMHVHIYKEFDHF